VRNSESENSASMEISTSLVNPKERRVVIVESVLSPTDYRNLLAKVLFKHFEVPSVIFVPAHLMACFPLGTQSALVVDVGYVETLVLPIFEGVPMLNCWQASPFGGKSVHNNLEKLLKTNGKVKSTAGVMALSQYPELLSESILEDIKVRTCFVTHMERGRMIQAALADPANQKKIEKTPPDVEYPLEGDKVLVLDGFVREAAFEVLFRHDEDDKSLAQLILDSVLKCPIDLRRPLLERIHVIGGGCMVPGFLARLKSELTDLLNDENLYGKKIVAQSLKFFKSPAKENFASWLGASIFGGLEILPHRSVSREQFQAKPTIPDWTAGADGVVEPTADIQQQR